MTPSPLTSMRARTLIRPSAAHPDLLNNPRVARMAARARRLRALPCLRAWPPAPPTAEAAEAAGGSAWPWRARAVSSSAEGGSGGRLGGGLGGGLGGSFSALAPPAGAACRPAGLAATGLAAVAWVLVWRLLSAWRLAWRRWPSGSGRWRRVRRRRHRIRRNRGRRRQRRRRRREWTGRAFAVAVARFRRRRFSDEAAVKRTRGGHACARRKSVAAVTAPWREERRKTRACERRRGQQNTAKE